MKPNQEKAETFNLVFPASISAVKKIGSAKWSDNFFMPVPRNTYFEIYCEIRKAYGKSLGSINPSSETYWSWAANYKIAYQITEYLYMLLLLKKLRENGFKSIFMSSEVKIGDAEKELPKLLSFPVISAKLNIFHMLVEKWRAIRTNWGGCSFSSYLLPSVFNSKLYILGGRGGGEVGAYLKDLEMAPVNLRPNLYLRKSNSDKFTSEINATVEFFKNEISGMLDKYGFSLPHEYCQDLARYISHCSLLISGTRENISGWSQAELIINPVANLKHRIFASAWRLSGGSVTGTVHGNVFAYGNVLGDMINGSNFILNRFVTMSSGEKKLFESARENHKTGLESSAEIYVCRNTIYQNLFKSLRKGSPPKSIKKIMLIGSPLNDNLPLSDRLCYLLMETELVSLLNKNNYRVIYKAHPDTLDETKGIFDMPECERLNDRFENVWDNCDCILFTNVFTTVFGLSLMTPKHIIALNWKGNSEWHPELLDLVKKRLSLIKVEYNDDGKPVFDKRALLDSLASPKVPDYSVVYKFALGEST